MKTALITQVEINPDRIADGDAVCVLKQDGSFRIFNCNTDMEPGKPMTPRQLEQGKALAAFALLLTMPELMEIVVGMACDPQFAGKVVDMGRLN